MNVKPTTIYRCRCKTPWKGVLVRSVEPFPSHPQRPLSPKWLVHQKKILYTPALIILGRDAPEPLWTLPCLMTLVLTSAQPLTSIQLARFSRLTVMLVLHLTKYMV